MRAAIDVFLAHLLRPTTQYQPDIGALLAAPTRTVVAVGAASKGQLAHRSALALADRLGRWHSARPAPGRPRPPGPRR